MDRLTSLSSRLTASTDFPHARSFEAVPLPGLSALTQLTSFTLQSLVPVQPAVLATLAQLPHLTALRLQVRGASAGSPALPLFASSNRRKKPSMLESIA